MDKECCFCGRKEQTILHKELNAMVCINCMLQLGGENDPFLPHNIISYLDRFVIGQEQAKRIVALSLFNHSRRVMFPDKLLPISHAFMIGPPGSGKTFIVEKLAEYAGLPCIIVDMNQYTRAGYIGKNIEEIIPLLIEKAGGDFEAAERGIIYLDEIDKKVYSGDNFNGDINGETVQQELLTMINGTTMPIAYWGNGGNRDFNTRRILFVAAGAFKGLNEIVEKRTDTRSGIIGFKPFIEEEEEIKGISPKDLIEFGMTKEFVGRIPNIATLDELTLDSLCSILTSAEESDAIKFKNLYDTMGIELEFAPEALNAIAQKAIKLGTGARALNGIVQTALRDITIELTLQRDVTKCIITEGVIKNGEKPLLLKRRQQAQMARA